MIAISTWQVKAQFDNIVVTRLDEHVPIADIQKDFYDRKIINMKAGDVIN